MSLTINTNVASLIAQYNLNQNANKLTKSSERLASGLRINHASDDAAGLSISESLRGQIRGTQKASENAQDGTNLLQIAEGALSVITEHLQRIREMTVQAANDTNSSVERQAIKIEVESRIEAINLIKSSTNFNNITLLDGSTSSYVLRIGAGSDTATNTLDISDALDNVIANFLSAEATAGALSNAFSDGVGCRSFLGELDTALKDLLTQRSVLGAYQSRLESTILNLAISKENLLSTESRIRDVDIAEETANMTTYEILREASISILSQANNLPAAAINLLNSSM